MDCANLEFLQLCIWLPSGVFFCIVCLLIVANRSGDKQYAKCVLSASYSLKTGQEYFSHQMLQIEEPLIMAPTTTCND